MLEVEFDFKVRDELKKMTEFKSLSKMWPSSLITEKEEQVTVDMFIDMIVYNSKGDRDLAIMGLRSSNQYLDTLDHLPTYYREACQLLLRCPCPSLVV